MKSFLKFFSVFGLIAVFGFNGCAFFTNDSSLPSSPVPINVPSGDDGGGGADGGGGSEAEPIVLSSSSVSNTASQATTFLALKALGFTIPLGDLGIASVNASKALGPESLNCSKNTDVILSCADVDGGASGSVRVTGFCGTTIPTYQHMGMIADLILDHDACVIGGVVMEGQLSVTIIAAAYNQDFDASQMEVMMESNPVDPYVMFGVGNEANAHSLLSMDYTVRLVDGALDTMIERALVEFNGILLPCVRNPVGGVDCGNTDMSQEELDLLMAQLNVEEGLCYKDDLRCDVNDVDENGVHNYCSNGICDDGCCENYEADEFVCSRASECPQLIGNNFSQVLSAVHFPEGADPIGFKIPLTCMNRVWQLPCMDDNDCRFGAKCNKTPTQWNYVGWRDFNDMHQGYGFCECFYLDTQQWEDWCADEQGEPLGAEVCCTDGIDNDGDCLIDCADANCIGGLGCRDWEGAYLPINETGSCADGIDNDFDRVIDCPDTECWDDPACEGDTLVECTDGVDNDGDALVDWEEGLCKVSCLDQRWEICPYGEDCENGRDDDGDDLVDCDDPECRCTKACPGPETETDCGDGRDNDCDYWKDCEDSDCWGKAGCQVENCYDTFDNDDNGLAGTLDPECIDSPVCTHVETDCANGLDDDLDFRIDADDCDCPGERPPTEVVCADRFDNDCDGATDCADSDCDNDPACGAIVPEDCEDRIDNDGDQLVDCDDPDCDEHAACAQVSCVDAQDCPLGSICERGFCVSLGCGTFEFGDNVFTFPSCAQAALHPAGSCQGQGQMAGLAWECNEDGCCVEDVDPRDDPICANGVDDDEDRMIDCDDVGCQPDSICAAGPTCEEISCEDAVNSCYDMCMEQMGDPEICAMCYDEEFACKMGGDDYSCVEGCCVIPEPECEIVSCLDALDVGGCEAGGLVCDNPEFDPERDPSGCCIEVRRER